MALTWLGLTAFARRGRARRGSLGGQVTNHSMLLVVLAREEQATNVDHLAGSALLHRSLPGEAVVSAVNEADYDGAYVLSWGPPRTPPR